MSKYLPIFLLFLTALAGCGDDQSSGASEEDSLVLDQGGGKADTFEDFGVSGDMGWVDVDADADADAGDVELSHRVRFDMLSGESFVGELVATYDTSLWWNPLDGLLYAIFDADQYALYPNDRSFRFVQALLVSEIVPIVEPDAPPTYREFLRTQDIYFSSPPFTNTSYVITGNESYHLEEDGFGDFAWDFEVTDQQGVRFRNQGIQKEDYLVWDMEVFSGVEGEVIEVVENGTDNVPGAHPDPSVAVNNMVGIALGGSFYAYYLHFKEDGVFDGIQVGTWVREGDYLGRVGNSGVTLEPHLHMVLLWFDPVEGRSYAVPSEFRDIQVAPDPAGPYEVRDWWVPESGEWLQP